MAKKQLKRRDFLKSVGSGILTAAAFDPVLMMVEQIFNSQAREAMAGTSNVKNFVYVVQTGAPSRWGYDLFLNPYANPGSTSLPTVYANQSLKTSFIPGDDTTGLGWTLDYKTFTYKTPGGSTINVPQFWAGNMPTANGGSVPLTNLMNSGMYVRGIAMPNDSHQTNQSKLLSPAQAEPTIPTLYQRNANQIISNPNSQSTMASILTPISKANYAYRESTSSVADFDKVHDAVNASLEQFAKEAKTKKLSSTLLYDLNKSVDANLSHRFFSNLDTLLASYTAALTKYTALFDVCADFDKFPVTGFTKNMPIPNIAPTGAKVNPKTGLAMNPMASMTNLGVSPVTNSDLKTIIKKGGKANSGAYTLFPQQFAVAETLLLAGLTQYVRITDGNVYNLNFEGLTTPYDYSDYLGTIDASQVANFKLTNWNNDEHGAAPGMILINQSFVNRGLSACIYELGQQLKTAGKWDNSVIMVSSEFNRNPNPNIPDVGPEKVFYGNGHQGYGNSFSIYSGMVKDTVCLGNIQDLDQTYFGSMTYTEANAIKFKGTTGWSAPLNVNGRKDVLTHSAFSTSLCDLLGIPRVFENFDPIWKIDGSGKIVPLVDKAQNNKFTV